MAGSRPTTSITKAQVFRINEYFATQPHMMLGHMANAGTMYRSNEPALVPDGRDLAQRLREAVAALPEGIYRAQKPTSRRESPLNRSSCQMT